MSKVLPSIVFMAILTLVAAVRDESRTVCLVEEGDILCDGHCVNKTMQCNDVNDCLGGEDEHYTLCGCKHDEFLCPDGCIPIVERCDLNCSCAECADEKDCEGFQCLPTHVKCANHLCIPKVAHCNFIDNCGDNSDEADCKHQACNRMFDFQCVNKQCISHDYVCDGVPDCLDGSDEARCNQDNFHYCEDGNRVHEDRRCNMKADCRSGSDEFHCECDPGQTQCPTEKRCFEKDIFCNSFCECEDCLDEAECVDHCDATNGIYCPWYDSMRGENRLSGCVRADKICDHVGDCDTWEDEATCAGSPFLDDTFVHACQLERPPRMIPLEEVCNGLPYCLNGTDEKDCPNGTVPSPCGQDEFQCADGTCRDGYRRCDGYWDCNDFSDEQGCEDFECPDDTMFKCLGTGQCLGSHLQCNGAVECVYMNGTEDTSDEDNCVLSECEPEEFRCHSNHCVAGWRRCFKASDDHINGCQDGSHLWNCSDYDCAAHGFFKCLTSYCIVNDSVCDIFMNCPGGFDEQDCVQECHPRKYPNCTCERSSFRCNAAQLRRFSFDDLMDDGATSIELINTGLRITDIDFRSNNSTVAERIVHLDLSHNKFEDLPTGLFVDFFSLRQLNLGYNHINRLESDVFRGLFSLKKLVLTGNIIQFISNGSFSGLTSLTVLDLSHQRLVYISSSSLYGLYKLSLLNISNNPLETVESGAFYGLNSLHTIDMSGNVIKFLHENTFKGLPELERIMTDEPRFCCVAQHIKECTPGPDEFSSCEDLMRNPFLRLNLWVVGLLATICNAIVIVSRSGKRRDSRVQSFLITNLAIGDMCMGIYLLIIAVADFNFRGRYASYDKLWRESIMCKLAGFLSTFSSELSVLSLTFITLHRVSSIVFPFRTKDVGFNRIVWIMTSTWVIVFLLGVIPLLGIPYFGNFYGRSGVCLALHITPDKPSGWEYAVFVFLVLNFFSFLFIAVAYIVMFYVARRTQQAAKRSLRANKGSDAMARKMTLIVATDAFCWMPIIILGVASLCGVKIHPQVFAWIAVFVLPLNSAVNPLLYTLWTTPYARRIITTISTHTFMRSTATSEYKLSANLSTSEKFTSNANGRRRGQRGFRGNSNSKNPPEKSNGSVRSCDVIHEPEESLRLHDSTRKNGNVYVNPNNNDDRTTISRTDQGKGIYERMIKDKGMEVDGVHSSGEE